jgi:hypothetical protein
MTTFFDSFENGNFRKWSYIQAQSTSQGGPGAAYNYVATGSSFGITAHSGSDVAQFYRPASASGLPHAKVYKEWSNVGKKDQYGRVEDKLPDSGNPSGVYSAWYYLPKDYQFTAGQWTNLFQFKEEGFIDGQRRQDPSWWLNIGAAKSWGLGSTEPVLFVNNWGNDSSHYNPKVVKAPVGRWFEIKAELHENDRIDWYLDGRKFDTSYDSIYDVGRFYDQSNGWIFGVGHYGGTGKVLVDDVKVTTFKDASSGTSGNDYIRGVGGRDFLKGRSGHDILNGEAGNDTLYGDAGNDTLYGGLGIDRVNGGAGNDTLYGNSSSDRFVFNSKLGTPKTDRHVNFDTIADFNVKFDSIWLDNAVFKKLGSGSAIKPKQLSTSYFAIDGAKDPNDYVIYNEKTGVLSYDIDGSGSKAAVEFAQLKTELALTYKNFFVL